MDVQIGTLESHIDVIDSSSMLPPGVIEKIVQAVLHELGKRESGEATHRSELDIRSIVEQQRGGNP